MNKKLLATFILALGISAGANAGSTIIPTMNDLGNGLIYDVGQNLIWTKNANINGLMNWDTAVTWANNLVSAGYTDWVLPTNDQLTTQFSTNLRESSGQSITASHNANYDLFTLIQNSSYWSATDYTNPLGAWVFDANTGIQTFEDKESAIYAWAVRPGDVAVAGVPLPAATWLFLSGLIGVLALKHRKNSA